MTATTCMRRTWSLRLAAAALLFVAAPAHAGFRDPQVPIQGSALQQAFVALGQTIDVATQQRLAPLFSGVFLTQPPLHFEASTHVGAAALSLYDGGVPGSLHEIVPAGFPAGWYSAVSFTNSGPDVTVSRFDAADVLQGTTTYHGVPVFGVGLAATDANGTFYSQDEMNPGGAPHLLYFRGTGAHQGDVWLAVESDGDGDFADALFLLAFFAPVPVERTNWGTLKRRFR